MMDLSEMQNVDLAKLKPGEPVVTTQPVSQEIQEEAQREAKPVVKATGPAIKPPTDEELSGKTPNPTNQLAEKKPTNQQKKPGLTWRLATSMRDLEITREISLEFHKRSHFAHIPFSHKKRDDFFEGALTPNSDKAGIICEYSPTGDSNETKIVGGAFCGVGEFMFGIDYLICTVYVFYITEDLKNLLRGKAAIGLVRAVKAWAKAKGAGEVMVHVTADTVQNDRFWRKIGAKVLGGNYVI